MFKFSKIKRCFIIAEISANHRQNFNLAIKMIHEARKAGADAVKFQAYTPDTLTLNCSSSYFQIRHPKWGGQTLYQLYQKAYTPWPWFKKLKKAAENLGLLFFATAFDKTSADFLDDLKIQIHKVASFELADLPFIEVLAAKKKPLILSTGMSTLNEIREAVKTALRAGAPEVALLKCTSAYPAPPQDMNLRAIPKLAKIFHLYVGLSDHTLGSTAAIAAVCLGAKILEKHFTLSRKIPGPDSFFSMEPAEFKGMVEAVRIAEKALEGSLIGPTVEEKKNRIFRRSLFVVQPIKKGNLFTPQNIRSIRPSNGLPPKDYKKVLGRRASKNLQPGTPLRKNFIC